MKQDRKWFAGGAGGGAYLPYRHNGEYQDERGVTWQVYSSTLNDLASIARLEAPCKRTRFVYDPGGHWRRALVGPPWSEMRQMGYTTTGRNTPPNFTL